MAVRQVGSTILLTASLGLLGCSSPAEADSDGAAGTAGAGGLPSAGGTGGTAGAAPSSEHPAVDGLIRPLIVGHGGAKDLCSENTLECFQTAIDLGAQALEADLQVLGDGTLVMFHDDTTLDQTGTEGVLLEMTLAEVQALDAGFTFTPDEGASFPERGIGLTIPTFDSFLEAFPDVPVLLDVKPESAQMADALRKYLSEDQRPDDAARIYVKSNDGDLAAELRQLAPGSRIAFSSNERTRLFLAPEEVASIPPSWIDLGIEFVSPETSEWARDRGHIFTASTIDDRAEMTSLVRGGLVDGIVTNRPDTLSDVLGR